MLYPHHLFSCFGVELEYMIVDRDTLNVKPICDRLLERACGQIVDELERGAIAWSNELTLHVVELKTNGPASHLQPLAPSFHENIREINRLLESFNACLLPSAMHPWMDPLSETQLWPHGYGAIYSAFDRIFSAQGHGWSNLQSVHLNLPFANDNEFVALHDAIRVVLPLLPALTASSPYVEGQFTGSLDARLLYYQQNQRKLPRIAGLVIPERVDSIAGYHRDILQPMYDDIAPYDPEQLLTHEWLNSRGAIARFDRGAIEIRVMDVAECPRADLAVIAFVSALLKKLTAKPTHTTLSCEALKALFDATVLAGPDAVIENKEYLSFFDLGTEPIAVRDLLISLKDNWLASESLDHPTLNHILTQGPLAQRLTKALGKTPSREQLTNTYRRLSQCLEENRLFEA